MDFSFLIAWAYSNGMTLVSRVSFISYEGVRTKGLKREQKTTKHGIYHMGVVIILEERRLKI